MTVPSNLLKNVVTYQKSGLAKLQNMNCFIANGNARFNNFQNFAGQLGDTVQYTKPTRYVAYRSLVGSPQPTNQRFQTLTVDKPLIVPYAFTAEQFIFNMENNLQDLSGSAVTVIGSTVESDMAQLAITKPYRYFGNGFTNINSFQQMATMLAQFRTYGMAGKEAKVFISDIDEPEIVGTGLNQFAINRNDKISNSWEIADWNNAKFYRSNLLAVHMAGNVGESQGAQLLTVVSTNDPTGNNITSITFSGASASDVNAIKKNDKMQFIDVPGSPKLRYLTFTAYLPCAARVQMSAVEDAASNAGGIVTISINPPLCATVGNTNQNIPFNIAAGMQVEVAASHRAGLVYSDNAMYLAMPRLPDQSPFTTSNERDEETGISTRLTYGCFPGTNTMGFYHDVIYGFDLVEESAMSVLFPL